MALGRKPIEIVESGTHQLLVKSDSWERVWLHQVAEVKNGFAFQSKFFNHDSGLPLIRIRDISKTATENLYSGKFEEEYLVLKGEILIGMDGDFNCARWQGKQALLNQRVCKIIPTTELYSDKFLYLCLQPYLNAINQETSSITVKHLSSKTVEEIPLPLPPLNEQHRIVAKIEELFSELDKGVESLKQAREQLKVYRQALLKHAFEGKLTEQWRKENADKLETAEQLLERIKHEREARYQQQLEEWKAAVEQWEKDGKVGIKPEKPKPQKTPEKIAQTKISELSTLPNKWKWVKLDELSSKITDGEHFKPIVTESGVYFISAKDVRNEGVNFDSPIYVSEETAIKARKRCDPERGDILIVSRGATVGRMCQVDTDKVFCLLGSVILIKALPLLDTRYLMYALKHPNVNREIISISGATAQQAVYLRDVKHVTLPLCCIEEQAEISNKLDEQLSNIQRMESDIDDNLARSEALRQSILKKAFSGQLVPQDPNDEPASVLLERIAREKAEAEAAAKKGRGAKKSQNV